MIKHNILLIYRNFKRNKGSFFINLIGLSTGLACTILIYLWVNDELNVDKSNKNDERLYTVMELVDIDGKKEVSDYTSGPLAETLVKEVPEVETAVASIVREEEKTLSVDDNYMKAIVRYASNNYFNSLMTLCREIKMTCFARKIVL